MAKSIKDKIIKKRFKSKTKSPDLSDIDPENGELISLGFQKNIYRKLVFEKTEDAVFEVLGENSVSPWKENTELMTGEFSVFPHLKGRYYN